jgi:hypothetical protein
MTYRRSFIARRVLSSSGIKIGLHNGDHLHSDSKLPDDGQRLASDMRLRLALEEVGQPYYVRLLSMTQLKQPAHIPAI